MSLEGKTYSAVRWTSFSNIARAVLHFLQVVILARLLTPDDFGLIAIVIVIMTFLQLFSDAGISNAIIHYQAINSNQLSSLYWLNLSVGIALAIIISTVSPWVAKWYEQPILQGVLIISSLSLVFNVLAQQLKVIAQKNLEFLIIAKVELWSAISGFGVAICSAIIGFGVYSIVFGLVTTSLIGCLLTWLWLSKGWRPSLVFHFGEVRKFLHFGIYMMGNNIANTINSQLDIILGGKLLSIQDIGFYNLSKDLGLRIASVINPIVTRVGLPVMAKNQHDKDKVKVIYLKTLRMTSSVNFPLYIALCLYAKDIVILLFGSQWQKSVPLLQVMAIWGLLRSTGNPVGILLLSLGRADLSFKWSIGLLFFIPPVIWFGTQFGLIGLSYAMLMIMIIQFIPMWYFLVRPLCCATLREYLLQFISPLAMAIFSFFLGYLTVKNIENNLYHLFFGIIISLLIYLLVSYKFNKSFVMGLSTLFFLDKK